MKYSKKTMMAILEFIVVCLAIVFVFKGIIMPIKVDGASMYPTLHDGAQSLEPTHLLLF